MGETLTRDQVEDIEIRWLEAKDTKTVQDAPVLREVGDAYVAWMLFALDVETGRFVPPTARELAEEAGFTKESTAMMIRRLRQLGVLDAAPAVEAAAA